MCALVEGRAAGAACSGGARCADPLVCSSELMLEETGIPDLAGGPARDLLIRAYPGDACTRGCDLAGNDDSCGACAECSENVLVGTLRVGLTTGNATCRARCVPRRDATGCDRDGYTCDPWSEVCLEACANDDQCRFVALDVGDGTRVIRYDSSLDARCDSVTGRCVVEGDDTAAAGDPCDHPSDCPDDSICLVTGHAGGSCTRLGCDSPGFECDTDAGEACTVRAFRTNSACLHACRVGAETDAERRGPLAHAPDCRPGYACSWDGLTTPSASMQGTCVPGNYNARTEYSVGAPCTSDAECFSPFGRGECVFATAGGGGGMCVVTDCATTAGGAITLAGLSDALPAAIAAEVCDVGRGDVCIDDHYQHSRSYCVPGCTDDGDCPAGFQCTDAFGAERVCWRACTVDADCPDGVCRTADGDRCESGDRCACRDAAR